MPARGLIPGGDGAADDVCARPETEFCGKGQKALYPGHPCVKIEMM